MTFDPGPQGETPGGAASAERIREIVSRAARLLPAQGPISIFVHHNPLHAFEDLPFERAVVEAGRLLGCDPFLPEWRFREELRAGRIRDGDLVRVLQDDLGPAGADRVGGIATRLDIRLAMLRHAVHPHRGHEMVWLLEETEATRVLRDDLPAEVRERLLGGVRARAGKDLDAPALERRAARELWHACLGAVVQLPLLAPPSEPMPPRPRDLLLAVTGVDTDTLVHPLLIRFCAAYLDQGLAQWALPGRERGFREAFLGIYGRRGGPPDAWLAGLPALAATERAVGGSDDASIVRSLSAFGIPPEEWEAFIVPTLLALRGWAGIVRQLELRPDRAPVHAPPVTLGGFLAVRLLLERLAAAHVARTFAGYAGALGGLRGALGPRVPRRHARFPEERAFAFFHLAQCLGLPSDVVAGLDPDRSTAILAEIEAFGDIERRRLFHLAYEHHHAMEVLGSLASHARDPLSPPPSPAFQAVFCIDEREESLRRHLEEVEPACETFGVPGYFGVAMSFQGLEEAHSTPLCPITVRPEHEVWEVAVDEPRLGGLIHETLRRTSGRAQHEMLQGTRSPARGTIFAALLGVLAAVPLVLRVLFPRWAARLHPIRLAGGLAPRTRLLVGRAEALQAGRQPRPGLQPGFTVNEMAEIVERLIRETGIEVGACPLVLIVGHGSSSLNNPHESAHDCGACGGGRGGPNARAFARMANDPSVRARLAARGRAIPDPVWFVAAYHNTCDDAISFLDEDVVPESLLPELARVRDALDEARARNAHERCRRFEQIPLWFPPALALAHVEDRAEDLAQPRPEYGHAGNAVCIVGRRRSTRGLFLDRRAFLVSYDPERDDEEGSVLAQVLASSGPVGAGINLEYYFSYVDPHGYGCHTKLPHNVSGLLGVMDGHRSDLRTGLPWQMVEIHEPVRLLLVVESEPRVLARVLDGNPVLSRLARNRWIRVVAWRPDTGELARYEAGNFVPCVSESAALPVAAGSADWYRGERGNLPPARIDASFRGAR